VSANVEARGFRVFLPVGLGEGTSGRWTCALFLSNSVSAACHAADVSGSVLAIGSKGRIYRTHSAALPVRIFDLTTTISVIDLEMR
jgi:hypothetical protein